MRIQGPNLSPTANRCEHAEPLQRTLFTARDYISGDRFMVRLCRQCSLVRTSPRPCREDLDRYYPPEYYGATHRFVPLVDSWLNPLQAKRSKQIHEANGRRAGAVLDIGCGRGLLLHHLRRLGWSVTGTELSDGAARFAREVLHLDVRVGDLERIHFEEGPYDAVVLWHVLEHFEDPAGVLHKVNRLVRPGGFVFLAVPNFGSIEAQLWRVNWFHLDVPRHMSHFTPKTLIHLLEAEQFRVERISYFSPEYDYFSFVQSALNRVGVHQNSLYDLLRARSAKLLRLRRMPGHRWEVLVNLALAPLLGLLAVVWVPVAARVGRGATMILYARKA